MISIFCLKEIGVLKGFGTYPAELVIFAAGHAAVDVVIPGDKALVPCGAQDGAFGDKICDIVFSADTVELHEQIHLDGPALFHGGGNIVTAADFAFQKVFGKPDIQINHSQFYSFTA